MFIKRKIIILLLSVLLLLPASVFADGPRRIHGKNRFETAIQVSLQTFEKSDTVFIANGQNYIDALPASTLANHVKAPILLAAVNEIPEATIAEIKRLGATKAYVLGGIATLDPAIESRLQELGITPTRVAGADRYETSEKLLAVLQGEIDVQQVFLTASVADAVSSSAYRGASIPLLLVKNGAPSQVVVDLAVDKTIVGGENTLSKETAELVRATSRISGSNRFETATKLATMNREENGVKNVLLVHATEFIDAFTATTFAYAKQYNILLTPGTYLEPYTREWAAKNESTIMVVGGTATITDTAIHRTEPEPAPKPEPKPQPKPEPKPEKPKIDPKKPMVAITYDDGPKPETTAKILDILKENDAKATFFVLGQSVNSYPNIVKRAVAEGHEIGNHSYGHPSLTSLSSAAIRNEIQKTNRAIAAAADVTPVFARPTYGNVNQTVRDAVPMPLINWSIDTRDWENRNAQMIRRNIMNNVQDGDIILMHDIHRPTVQATEIVIPELIEKGYQLVTLSELFEYKGITPKAGYVYRHAR